MSDAHLVEADPFDLPEWLGLDDVIWRSGSTVVGATQVRGSLAGRDERLDLDLLAVDAAVPGPVCPEKHRTEAHHAWHRGETLLVELDGRLTLAVPGSAFDVDLVCEAIRRFTRAVGATASHYCVQIRL